MRAILADPDPLTRVKAAEAIAVEDPEAAKAALVRVTGEADMSARREAARALEIAEAGRSGGLPPAVGRSLRLGPRLRRRRGARSGRTEVITGNRVAGRAMLSVVPWIVGLAGLSAGMLWFVQRPSPVRLLAWSACAAWSAAWGWGRAAGRTDDGLRRVLAGLAFVAAALGMQGTSLGLSPTGVFVSVLLSAAAALVWVVVNRGSRVAGMKTAAIALATILAFACTETLVRLTGLGSTARETDSRELARRFNNITPPRTAFVNQPKPLDEFPPALVEINSAGTRGPELSRGAVDVLLLGDSFVEARQLPWDQTLGPRLQSALDRRAPGARVVSHGMRGWSPLLEWNWYLKVGRQFRPRVVLLFFFWNDLWSVGTEAQTFRAVLGPDGRPDHFDAQVDSAWLWYKPLRSVRIVDEVVRLATASGVRRVFRTAGAEPSRQASALDLPAARRLAQQMAGDPQFTGDELTALLESPLDKLPPGLERTVRVEFWPGIRPLALWTAEQRRAAERTESELAGFAADVAADGGRLVIVYVPNAYQIGPAECSVGRFFDRLGSEVVLPPASGIQAWLRALSARRSIELLDPSDAMRPVSYRREKQGEPPLYLRADCHWSPAGHQFMADWLADWYVQSEQAK